MSLSCPYCIKEYSQSAHQKFYRIGFYYRRSDSRTIQRYRCAKCLRSFSRATFHPCYRQNKRQKNRPLRNLLCSGVSGRRAARLLHLNRKTVARKLIFLGIEAKKALIRLNSERNKVKIIEFDDVETFEHTKCKPLAISLVVEKESRWILDFEVSPMAVKSSLIQLAERKYGKRKDERKRGRQKLFSRIKPLCEKKVIIKSDENPHYPKDVRDFFPESEHQTFKGRRGAIVGQGELKKVGFDPLFSLNHTAAMLRANVNRLVRKTWCTTKKAERLVDHLMIYAIYHNQELI